MSLLDEIYKNRKDIGLKKNVSFDEMKRLDILIEDYYINNTKNTNTPIDKDIKKMVDLSIKMTDLLNKCRQEKLPIGLAKEIDNLLNEIKYL
jgi:hypothetical protein